MIKLQEYIDRRGRNLFARWFSKLDATAKIRITSYLERVEHGNFSAAKGVGSGVFELRLNFGPGYRIYCGRDGELLVILLCGGSKRRQQDDIAEAHALWHEYTTTKQEVTPWP